ncbi:hypothetical protein [Bosea sp. (in: a-proteobacteria)]|uniref:hypothetical protein n=1 Tax=Bosea sp. (in: a-proteobacteria) TaxID=1871050 RepID=UPI002735C7F1|nr:hypothetical protein [Bosea sp. (in: a-proteobacteria)]MDP3408669.1 hypothetical protein [Bosea sp. (in: a-proteobacteria)]
MFRKTLIMALIVLVSGGTVLAKAPLDPGRGKTSTMRHGLAEQTAPQRLLRFKATRAVHLRTAEIETLRVARG